MIENIIYDVYSGFKKARMPKDVVDKIPVEEPWTPSEVSLLIKCIVNTVNSKIAAKYFENNEEGK